MKKGKHQTISVVIPTKARPEFLYKVLKAIETLKPSVYEVIVVDTGRGSFQKRTKEIVYSFGRIPARYIELSCASASEARNKGISRCTGEIVAFLDDDCIPLKNWMREIKRAASVGPFWFRGRTIDMSSDTSIIHDFYIFTKQFISGMVRNQWKTLGTWRGYKVVDRLQAGNFFVHRKTIDSFGKVFDDDLFPFIGEESDLSLRIRASGQQILFVPRAGVNHLFLRLNYMNMVVRTPFWFGRASAIFQARSRVGIRAYHMFGFTKEERIQRKAIRFWLTFVESAYVLYKKNFKKSRLYNYVFAIISLHFISHFALGFVYGRLEQKLRKG